MPRLITVTGLFIAIGLHAAFFKNSTDSEPAKEASSFTGKGRWKMLFDEKTLNGWHLYGKDHAGTCWQIENKALHLVPVSDGQDKGDLVTDDSFANFDLKLEWKVARGSNSGVIFLVHEDTALFKATFITGPEMQVLDNIGADDNKQENHLAGALYDLAGKAADSKPKPVGEWNKSEIICDHGQLKLYLNKILIVSTTLWDDHWRDMVAHSKFKNMPAFGTYKSGRIALQYHGGEVWYRNIRLRDLN